MRIHRVNENPLLEPLDFDNQLALIDGSRLPSPRVTTRSRKRARPRADARATPEPPVSRSALWVSLGLIAAVLVVYTQVRQFGFVTWDDPQYVSENPHVLGGLGWQSIRWAFTTTYAGFWLPLTWLSFMLDVNVWGPGAGGHHVTNVVLHAANTLLLFGLLHRTTRALWRSAFVAALFGVHPLHVESVAWVTERKDVLSTFFGMLALWAYVGYVKRPALVRYLGVVGAFALALLAKPMLVTLPFVLLLLDFWPLKRWQEAETPVAASPGRGAPARRKPERIGAFRKRLFLIAEKIPLFLLVIGSSILTYLAQRQGGAVAPLRIYPLSLRLENAVVSYVRYLLKMFWPGKMAAFYPYPAGGLPAWQVAASILVLLIAGAFVLAKARRFPYLTVGWFWFVGTLVPVIGVVQVGEQAMADRYTYIPYIGLFIALTWLLADLIPNGFAQKAVAASVSTAAVVVLALLTWVQTSYWQNSITLFEHAIRVTRNNHLAENNLGYALSKAGNWDEAIAHYRRSLQITPNYVHAHNNLGAALAHQGKVEEAMFHYREALRLRPDQPEAQINIGIEMAQQGRSAEALNRLSEAIRFKPDDPKAHYNMGLVLAEQGRWNEAALSYQTALRYKPDYPEAHMSLAVALAQMGKTSQAFEHYHEALRQRPDYAEAHINLGIELAMQNRLQEAARHFSEAARLKPDSAEAHFNLGKALLFLGRKQEALKELEVLQKLRSPLAVQLEGMLESK